MRSTRKLALMAGLAIQSSKQEAHPMVDSFSPLVPMKDYVPPSDLDNDPNYYYPTDYRILDCWKCFEA